MTEASSASPSPERPLIEASWSRIVMTQNPRIMRAEKKTALGHEKERNHRPAKKNAVINNRRHSRVRVYNVVHLDRLQLHVSPPHGLRDPIVLYQYA